MKKYYIVQDMSFSSNSVYLKEINVYIITEDVTKAYKFNKEEEAFDYISKNMTGTYCIIPIYIK